MQQHPQPATLVQPELARLEIEPLNGSGFETEDPNFDTQTTDTIPIEQEDAR